MFSLNLQPRRQCKECGIYRRFHYFYVRYRYGHFTIDNLLCRICTCTRQQIKRQTHPDIFAGYDLKKKYGITFDDKKAMIAAQDGKCAACKTSEPGGKYGDWQVDHNHKTKKVRALLCGRCNLTIGNADESIERLRALADYLEHHAN